MADFEPPSFSLGFDFDLDSLPPPPSSTNPTAADDFDVPATAQALKRLRRGPGPEPEMKCESGDDEIEEFSSQEDPSTVENMPPSSLPYSGCSTSKFSLHGHRVFTTQSTGKCKMAQKEQVTDTPASTVTKANSNGFTFPKLTVSPLRKFQLLDSDSESDTDSDPDFDDPCANEYANTEVNKVNSSSEAKLNNPVENPTISRQKRANVSECVSRGQDLWDDFYTEKRFTIPTPALDEVCEEYFRSVKNNRTDPPSRSVGNRSREIKGCVQTSIVIDDDDDAVHCKLGDPVPPAHHYFHHDDPRVRNLVRSRLPYFSPLGVTLGRNQHTVQSAIDYMSQFNNGPCSKPQAAQKTNSSTGSKRVKKNSRKSNIEEVPEGSRSWVNPRSRISIPTDAGKRRVQAVGGQSAGHWFTSPEGKRVYVSKTGQELTGRAAYTHYRKESGKGFKRSVGKKNGGGKKKSVGKKKAAANKR